MERERQSREYWEQELSEYWDSGLTIQEYSELKELPYESVRRWIRRLKQERTGVTKVNFYCAHPVNLRKSFDGLAGAVQEYIGCDPASGHLFVFFSRNKKLVKMLFYQDGGLSFFFVTLTGRCSTSAGRLCRNNYSRFLCRL